MPLTWLTGLYAPARDIAKGITSIRSRGLVLTIEANAQGPQTWITVTAQCGPGGKPHLVRGCWAELYETAYDACSGPQPVRTRLINFRPGGHVAIRPDEPPIRWEAHVLNERVRRAVRELDNAATIRAYGEEDGHEALSLRDRRERERQALRRRHPLLAALAQLAGEPHAPKMRAVLEPIRGQNLITRDIAIPPHAPFPERWELLTAYLTPRLPRTKRSAYEDADIQSQKA
jgi:hypothetical protein